MGAAEVGCGAPGTARSRTAIVTPNAARPAQHGCSCLRRLGRCPLPIPVTYVKFCKWVVGYLLGGRVGGSAVPVGGRPPWSRPRSSRRQFPEGCELVWGPGHGRERVGVMSGPPTTRAPAAGAQPPGQRAGTSGRFTRLHLAAVQATPGGVEALRAWGRPQAGLADPRVPSQCLWRGLCSRHRPWLPPQWCRLARRAARRSRPAARPARRHPPGRSPSQA